MTEAYIDGKKVGFATATDIVLPEPKEDFLLKKWEGSVEGHIEMSDDLIQIMRGLSTFADGLLSFVVNILNLARLLGDSPDVRRLVKKEISRSSGRSFRLAKKALAFYKRIQAREE